jgi:hypothetical protein
MKEIGEYPDFTVLICLACEADRDVGASLPSPNSNVTFQDSVWSYLVCTFGLSGGRNIAGLGAYTTALSVWFAFRNPWDQPL